MDLALAEHFKLLKQGRMDAELRMDAFNVFNHTNFGNPSTNINSACCSARSPRRRVRAHCRLPCTFAFSCLAFGTRVSGVVDNHHPGGNVRLKLLLSHGQDFGTPAIL